jgi:hypothetical protein
MSAPPGFYDDGTGRARWWDGASWAQVSPSPSGEKRRRASLLQRLWIILQWSAAAWAAYLLVAIPFSSPGGTEEIGQVVGAGAGAVACLAGAFMAHGLFRNRLPDPEFIKATTTVRVIACTWLLFIGAVALSVFAEVDELAIVAESSFLSLVGPASILAIIGPAYSEFVSARALAPAIGDGGGAG